jgi:hypothetical protein
MKVRLRVSTCTVRVVSPADNVGDGQAADVSLVVSAAAVSLAAVGVSEVRVSEGQVSEPTSLSTVLESDAAAFIPTASLEHPPAKIKIPKQPIAVVVIGTPPL